MKENSDFSATASLYYIFEISNIAMNFPDSCDSSGVQLRARAGEQFRTGYRAAGRRALTVNLSSGCLQGGKHWEMSSRIWGCSCGSSRQEGEVNVPPKAMVPLHFTSAASWALQLLKHCQKGKHIILDGETWVWMKSLVRKSGEMRKCISEFTGEGWVDEKVQTSSNTAGIISQEQQWRPCLCPAPDAISFGISFHLEQPPQENDPNSCTALGAVLPSHWYQPHLWFHLFHAKCSFNSAEQFRVAAKMEFFTVPPSPDLAVPSLPFSHTVSEVCSM